jgi:hypothetical protein
MNGPNSSTVREELWLLRQPSSYNVNGTRRLVVVVCTTCHNQHLMNVVKVEPTAPYSGSGLPGRLLRDHVLHSSHPYNPASITAQQQPDGTVLPPVPRWRGQRVQQRCSSHNLLIAPLHKRGRDHFPPLFFLNRMVLMRPLFPICSCFSMFQFLRHLPPRLRLMHRLCPGAASHAANSGSTGSRARPVARVNGYCVDRCGPGARRI